MIRSVFLLVQWIALLYFASADTGSSLRSRIESDLIFNYSHRPVIYMFSQTTGEVVIPFIMQLTKIKSTNILCVDATETSLSEALKEFTSSRSEQALMVIRGVESLRDDQIANLNFLHGVSNSNSEYPSLVVVFLWDTSLNPIPSDTLFRDYFLTYLRTGGDSINPTAILGRFSLTAVDGSVRGSNVNFNAFWSALCTGEHTQNINQEHSLNTAAIMCGVVLLIIAGLACMPKKSDASDNAPHAQASSPQKDQPIEEKTNYDEQEEQKNEEDMRDVTPQPVKKAPRGRKSTTKKAVSVSADNASDEEEDDAAEHEAINTPAPTRGRRSVMRTPARSVRKDSDDDTVASMSVRRSTRKSKPVQYYE